MYTRPTLLSEATFGLSEQGGHRDIQGKLISSRARSDRRKILFGDYKKAYL
jgi:hypothetical protein